jgi:hypothetical protein
MAQIPTFAQMATAMANVTSSSQGESLLSPTEVTQVYTTFSNTCGLPAAQRQAGWVIFLQQLGDVGGARSWDPEDRPIRVQAGNTLHTGARYKDILVAIALAVHRYTHQRLMNSIPNHVAAAVDLLGRPTNWAEKNGLAGLVQDKYGFPAAVRCNLITSDDKLRIRGASVEALPQFRQEMISHGMTAARQAIASGAMAQGGTKLALEF